MFMINELILTSLNLTILTLTITIFLYRLPHKTKPTQYLLGAMAAASVISVSYFVGELFHLPLWYMGMLAAGFGGAALIQFGYHFPALQPTLQKEAKALYKASLVILGPFFILTILQALNLVPLSFSMLWTIPLLAIAWTVIVLLRQWRGFSTGQGTLWQVLRQPPPNESALACRSFLRSFLFLLLIPIVQAILPFVMVVPPPINLAITNTGFLLFIFTATLNYVNYAKETISFMVKLVGSTLTIMLIIVGNLWAITIIPVEDVFQQNIPLPATNQTVRFTPNQNQSYDIVAQPFQFDPDVGQHLQFQPRQTEILLPFPFEFYGTSYPSIFIAPDGLLTFTNQEIRRPFVNLNTLPVPAIMPYFGQLTQLNHPESGTFARIENERVIITWHNKMLLQPIARSLENASSMQVILYANGSFDITYRNFNPQNLPLAFRNLWGIGISPGPTANGLAAPLPFAATINYHGSDKQAIFQDYGSAFNLYLQQYLWPFFWAAIVGSIIILAGFPYFFRKNLVKPLEQLLGGVGQVNAGQLEVQVPVQYEDEIGFLARSFNGMMKNLKAAEQERQRTALLEKEKKTAEAANQAKSAFLANMSHELRSPLNAILGFSQIIRRDKTLSPETQDNLGIIIRSGEHLLTLINQVLDLSKIEANRITLNETDFDLSRLLDDLEDMFALKAEDKGLHLICDRPANLAHFIRTDETKLRQILINLLNNGLKFTEEGGVTLRVAQKSNPEGPPTPCRLHFEIEDTGPGIAPEELDQLFEAFAQTETGRRAQEGTGLGLPISRKFVQLMGGDIDIKSEVGYGTIFKFDILCQPVTLPQKPKIEVQKQIIALEPDQPRYRILAVDDKWANRQLLIKLLNPLGFELREAENGQEAIEVWQDFEPHLIWMDMRMPILNGFEATRQIKSTTQGQATAIIALTASSFEEERAIILSAGCDDFVRKPFRDTDIFQMMHKHIGVRYVYDKAVSPSQEVDPALTTKHLVAEVNGLPPEILAQLIESTELGDIDMIAEVLTKIEPHRPALAKAFSQLADNFEYDKLLRLVAGAKV